MKTPNLASKMNTLTKEAADIMYHKLLNSYINDIKYIASKGRNQYIIQHSNAYNPVAKTNLSKIIDYFAGEGFTLTKKKTQLVISW